jgi:hypothetical protein
VVFDANNDGVIERWSFSHGGDSFATFTPPPSASSASGGGGASDGSRADRTADHGAGHHASPAAIRHARRSYQQDGLAGQPAAPAPTHSAPAPSTPAPSPPAGGHPAGSSA